MNLVSPSPASKKVLNPSSLKIVSSHSSCSTVALATLAFNAAHNLESHASLRPKRRSHEAPSYAKTYPPIKNSLTSSSPIPSSLQVSTTSKRKDFHYKICNLSS